MSRYEDRKILMKAKLATDEDWQAQIQLAKMYFLETSKEMDADYVANVSMFKEVKDAWIEYKTLLVLHQKYIDMIMEDKIEEALDFADEILWGKIETVYDLEKSWLK